MQKKFFAIKLYVSYYQKDDILIYDAEFVARSYISSKQLIKDLFENGSIPKQWIEISLNYVQVLPVVRYIVVNKQGYKLDEITTLSQLGLKNNSKIIIVLDQLLFECIQDGQEVCCHQIFYEQCQLCKGKESQKNKNKFISLYDSKNEYHIRYWNEQFFDLKKINLLIQQLIKEQKQREQKQQIEQNPFEQQQQESSQYLEFMIQSHKNEQDNEYQEKKNIQESQLQLLDELIRKNTNNFGENQIDQQNLKILEQDSVDQCQNILAFKIQTYSADNKIQPSKMVKHPKIQKSPPLLKQDDFDSIVQNNIIQLESKNSKILGKDIIIMKRNKPVVKIINNPIQQQQIQTKAQITQVEQVLLQEMNQAESLIKQNLFDIDQGNQEQLKIIKQEQDILIDNFQCKKIIQRNEDKTFKILEQQKYHKIENAIKRRIDENKINKQIIDPLKIDQQQVLQDKNQELIMYVLADQMKNSGKSFYQSNQSEQLNIYSLQASFSDKCEDTVCEKLILQETPQLTFNQLKKDNKQEKKFYTTIKDVLAKQYKVKPEDVNILSIEYGSISVKYKITGSSSNAADAKQYTKDEVNKLFPGSNPVLVVHQYFDSIQLSSNDFDPRFNMEWNNQSEYELRGPPNDKMKYFFPKGWKGYALKVQGKFDNGKDDWLLMDSNINQWHIMYHGTDNQGCKGIVQNGFKAGSGQTYSSNIDIRFNQVIGDGIYFSNHIEVCEGYCKKTTVIKNIHYKVVFMSRVRPSSLKQVKKQSDIKSKQGNSDWDNDYFVINKPEDIRPYRILLKKI